MRVITKKAVTCLSTAWIILCFFMGCSQAQDTSSITKEPVRDGNILIVYLSRTKNTKAVAEMIQQNVGGTLVKIELRNPYPEDYKTTVDQVAKENETGFLPPLKTKVDDIGKYDTIYIGFPTWGMKLPPPMKSFLKQYNLKGKTIIPFNTNAGYGLGNSFETIKELWPESKVLKGFSVEGGRERDGILFAMEGEKEKQVQSQVKNWLRELNVL